ncbi:ABC transporter ATP-binding protein [Catenisphaera adipataccumulans]|uniref:ATP-binding cassette subfamily B protein n=1 Tax=Catenisphaera adipataccumulans TaxID=700500 RepID=A0A7W8CWX5_9FIRM|nr:ABC transporter ATP-binding protein [Catenisphaera adipataccumulans]MBB5183088.1 ATP-binding cassette subfamily B protein [Catenisphaera adipataccumulans]
MKKIRHFLIPYRRTLILMVVLGTLSSVADSFYPLFTSYALDHFIAGQTLDTMPMFIGAYIGLMILQELDNYYCLFQCGRIEMCLDCDLRDTAFHHLQTLSFTYFNQHNVGSIHARVMSDTGKIGEMFAWRLMDLVWNVSYVICVFAVMFTIHRQLAFFVALIIPIAVVIIYSFQKKLTGYNRKVREINAEITDRFNEGLSGMQSIQINHVEQKMFRRFQDTTSRMYQTSIKTTHYAALLTAVVTMMSSCALAIVLQQGGYLTASGALRIGTLAVFMSYAIGLLSPIQNIMDTIASWIGIRVNIDRLSELLAQQPEVKDTPAVIEKYGTVFVQKRNNWEPLNGDVSFEDVTFRYPDGTENVLEHFSLHVPQGSTVGIVGETGAGKSTLVNLVCRFYEPQQGRILIDGRDVRKRSQSWLHAHIGYVLQTPQLFSGTIRENLKYGNEQADDRQIEKALHLMAADDIVRQFPEGLDHEIGEGGDSLSTGQKQLLSLTRALLADPQILILDEATASIDTLTERKIQNAIRTVSAGRTTFVIAHRLSTVTDADWIIAIRDGKIEEQGTHAELMKQNGYYAELVRHQNMSASAENGGIA